MHTRKLLALALALGLLVPTAATAAPLAGPCVSGGGYNSACDANQDGSITITDIQLTAGHWNQTGTFVSDSNHTHLGQTWTGNGNPLVLQGSYGSPSWAPLALSNSAGAGVRINAAGGSGVWVESALLNGVLVDAAGANGLYVGAASLHGVYVRRAGNPSYSLTNTDAPSGVSVGGAERFGLWVGRADQAGVHVYDAPIGYFASYPNDGLFVSWAYNRGVYVEHASVTGVDVAGNNLAGYFAGAVQVTGGCTGCRLATFGVNTGDKALAPGDLVSLAGLRASGVDSVPMLLEVQTATGGDAVVGVVQGWAEQVTEKQPRPGEIGLRLVPRDGAAAPGQFVTIAYSGLTQVRASGPVEKGARLAVGDDGRARTLQSRTLDGMVVTEGAPLIGIALEPLAAGDGLIWVLVNVQ